MEKTIHNSFWTWLFQSQHTATAYRGSNAHEETLWSLFLAGSAATGGIYLAVTVSWWYLLLFLCVPIGALGVCHAFWREKVQRYEQIP